jgi:PAS domain S-box-containing protein
VTNFLQFDSRDDALSLVDKNELEQLVDGIAQQLLILGTDGSGLFANQSTLQYTGLELEEIQQEDDLCAKIFHPDDLKAVRLEFACGVSCEASWETEARILDREGKYRWFLIRCNPLGNEREGIDRWCATATDIEDRKRAEDELQKALDEIKQLKEQLHEENVALKEEVDRSSMFEEIVGTSPVLQTLLSRVAKVAPTNSTVLITGETGTGKELIARAIHKRSQRSSRPFVSVNCAAIPPGLIASELFGHEKGAFTGAVQRRLGRFELAEGGTLFLDEVGELPAETQIALLRVLQEREFERVGGNRLISADVRVIAATNRDLKTAIEMGTFRSDLFYRLNVFPIQVPSLRERKDDIPVLVEYFMARYANRAGKKIRSVSQKTLTRMQAYTWPGNIRELQNVMERSVILCETENLSVDQSWLAGDSVQNPPAGSPLSLSQKFASEKEKIEAALRDSAGRVSGPFGAAAILGIPRSTLEWKIRSLNIDKYRFKR